MNRSTSFYFESVLKLQAMISCAANVATHVENFVASNDLDRVNVVFMFMRLGLGSLVYDENRLILDDHKSIFIEFGSPLKKFLLFLQKTLVYLSEEKPSQASLSMQNGFVLVARDTKGSPIISISKKLKGHVYEQGLEEGQGKEVEYDIPILNLNCEEDILSLLTVISDGIFYGLWIDDLYHDVALSFCVTAQRYLDAHDRLMTDFNTLPRPFQNQIFQEVFENLEVESIKFPRLRLAIKGNLNYLQLYVELKDLAKARKGKTNNAALIKSSSGRKRKISAEKKIPEDKSIVQTDK